MADTPWYLRLLAWLVTRPWVRRAIVERALRNPIKPVGAFVRRSRVAGRLEVHQVLAPTGGVAAGRLETVLLGGYVETTGDRIAHRKPGDVVRCERGQWRRFIAVDLKLGAVLLVWMPRHA